MAAIKTIDFTRDAGAIRLGESTPSTGNVLLSEASSPEEPSGEEDQEMSSNLRIISRLIAVDLPPCLVSSLMFRVIMPDIPNTVDVPRSPYHLSRVISDDN
jgi:hypothetical protein